MLDSHIFAIFWLICFFGQSGAVVNGALDGYWRHGAPTSQNHHITSLQPQIQKTLDQNYSYNSFQDPQKSSHPQSHGMQYTATHQVSPMPSSQGSNFQYTPTQQVPQESQTYQPPPQSVQSLDTRRVSKMQIPTNPRIASNLTFGLQKTEKESSTTSAVTKPAYISVSIPKANEKVSSSTGADSILKVRILI